MSLENDFELEEDIKVKYPKKYKVFLLNDDYTTMDFVVDILMSIFYKNYNEAETIMLDIHKNGQGLCGIYNHEIAQTKVIQVETKSKDAGFPLKAIMEQE